MTVKICEFSSPQEKFISFEDMNTIIQFERIWSELALWLRSLIITSIRDKVREPFVADKLLKGLAVDLYNTFQVFYGPQLAQEFLNDFSNFIIAIWRLAGAFPQNSPQEISQLTVNLYNSADVLANFLARINIYWNEDQWKYLLHQYIKSIIDEIIAISTKDFSKDIQISDSIGDLGIVIGNYMARGIISRKQELPQK